VEACCKLCPKTVALLKRVPGVRTALLSKLGPGTVLGAHRGWADLSNHILRTHLGLIVPGDGAQCGTWVQGEVRHHAEREIIVFDDSLLHKAFNETEEERVVLIVDVARPPGVPKGRAKGGHTKELDGLISLFS
jgi:aspartyl/asparaginyl beta-hydroxylase (cupin superfamily)